MEPFPEEIARFIETHIASVDELEILRILAADRSKEWSRAGLARTLHAQPPMIAERLNGLHQRGLLTVASGSSLCRYGPSTPDLERAVNCLLQLYEERPVTLIRMVYANGNGAAEEPPHG